MSRVTEAYPEVFAGLETDVRRRVVLALGTSPDGSLPVVDDVTDLVDRICTGGWPGLIDARPGDARRWLRDYLDDAIHVDLTDFGPRRRDPQTVRRALAALARHLEGSST